MGKITGIGIGIPFIQKIVAISDTIINYIFSYFTTSDGDYIVTSDGDNLVFKTEE